MLERDGMWEKDRKVEWKQWKKLNGYKVGIDELIVLDSRFLNTHDYSTFNDDAIPQLKTPKFRKIRDRSAAKNTANMLPGRKFMVAITNDL